MNPASAPEPGSHLLCDSCGDPVGYCGIVAGPGLRRQVESEVLSSAVWCYSCWRKHTVSEFGEEEWV